MADVAWTRILTGEGQIDIGDSVSAGEVGGDEELEALKEAGAVRDEDYPEDVGENESPREMNIRKLNEAVEEAQAKSYESLSDLSNIAYSREKPIETEESTPEVTPAATRRASKGAE